MALVDIATELDIANLALSKLGHRALTSFDDATAKKAADTASVSFRNYLKSVMSQYPWKFCTVFDVLSPGTLSADVYDYAAAYDIPANTLRVYAVRDQTSEDGNEWTVRDGQILTNLVDETADLSVQLIMYESDVTKYSPEFIDAVAERCAAEWSPALVRISSESERLQASKNEKVRDAMSSDGGVGSPVRYETYASSIRNRS